MAQINKVVFFRSSAPNYDVEALSDETGVNCQDPSRTRQADAHDADINNIVKNFGLTGRLPQSVRVPTYGDFDVVTDYRSAMDAIRSAEASFSAMDAGVRSRFENNPQLFLEFCSDPANLEEMKKLGLAVSVTPAVVVAEQPIVADTQQSAK